MKEAVWTISNITAGTSAQIEAVIEAWLIPPLIKTLNTVRFIPLSGQSLCSGEAMPNIAFY